MACTAGLRASAAAAIRYLVFFTIDPWAFPCIMVYRYDIAKEKGWRAGSPALAENSFGCFLPDLTRFTTMQCGGARRNNWFAVRSQRSTIMPVVAVGCEHRHVDRAAPAAMTARMRVIQFL